jgi:RNA polymerase sigma factor (sigma-70 family)
MTSGEEPLSLDAPMAGGTAGLGDIVADHGTASPFESAAAAALPGDVARLLAVLDERERKVIAMRFGLAQPAPLTLEQIGEHFHLSRERIRQIELRAMAKLRRQAGQTSDMRELLAV